MECDWARFLGLKSATLNGELSAFILENHFSESVKNHFS
jgi:hypothetical protein